ncbi:nucleoside diphosphate kinase 6-like [Phlebotomus argentipes]|uniref:nucleoside diphosphate kinase 6-like n=1 Tax=Phlebotomus argentipes TaxID=94469 RepID=UPI002893101E|nr:nucleoside diphosphate kinase 6-like [Phlebotomus argentipes]
MIREKPLELTLAIIKPHVIKNSCALTKIRDVILRNDFQVVKNDRVCISRSSAEDFYAEHSKKFFYQRLVTFMSSGPSDVYILARENAIAKWRELLGPTKVYKTIISHPESIRGRFGISDTRNAAHGSDSQETAEKEIKFFFPAFDVKLWRAKDEELFRMRRTVFNPEKFLHELLC